MSFLGICGRGGTWTVVLTMALMVGCASEPAGDGESAAPDAASPAFPSTGADIVGDGSELPGPVEDVAAPAPEDVATPDPEDVATPDPEDAVSPAPEDVGEPGTPDAEVVEDVCATAGCDLLAVPDGGCVETFECDPEFMGDDGTHCKPVYKSSGSPCVGTLNDTQVHVVPSDGQATDEAPSVCDRFVCHGEADSPSACVLVSSLPEETQGAMDDAGFSTQQACSLSDMPGGAAADCNHVQCVCATDACMDAQCQVTPDTETMGQACAGLDMCWTGTCTALGDQPYMCVQHPVACPSLSDAWCAVAPACDPVTGCPVAVDQGLSDAKCGGDDPCLVSASCDPDNPEADEETGCITVYEDPETGCGDQIVGVSAGSSHSFVVQADGTIHWWGTKTYAEPPEGVLFKQVSGG
ncbi:MAG: hypothetical protein VX938_11155, partial [Myxococcota bacterium]|nr:hypothetical protein [Myxococcota bacterium]